MNYRACPKCGRKTSLGIMPDDELDRFVIVCDCGFKMKLETKLPCKPEDLIEEWNRRVKTRKEIKMNSLHTRRAMRLTYLDIALGLIVKASTIPCGDNSDKELNEIGYRLEKIVA